MTKVYQFQSDVQYVKDILQSTKHVFYDTWDMTTGSVSQKLNVIRQNGQNVANNLKSWYKNKKSEL